MIHEKVARDPREDGILDALIVGAGMSGLLAAIRLKQAGLTKIRILERNEGLGGTWWSNRYPGCACDIPSHFYSYSFAPNPDWTRAYPQQSEILAYFERVTDRYRLRGHIRFATEVKRAVFDSGRGTWTVTTADGAERVARVLILATGQLSRPLIPAIAGAESFHGPAFHSAEWPGGLHLRGKRVAVIGTGPSAAQIVPAIAPEVARLVVFQRTPNWFHPRGDRAYRSFERWLFRHLPGYARLHRALIYLQRESLYPGFRQGSLAARLLVRRLRRMIERQVRDPDLRARLTPDYPPGCKRVIVSDDFLPALQRPDVTLESDPIARITPNGIITASGGSYEVDAIVYGTGFRSTEFVAPIEVVGETGVTLRESWADGAEAYCGSSVAGFPNMFILYGPNTNLGHNSIIFMVERQVEHVMRLVRLLFSGRYRSIAVRPAVMDAYNQALQARLDDSVWKAGCRSWYMTEQGKITNNWPYSTFAWKRQLREVKAAHYELRPVVAESAVELTG
jgi:cation diffusion facilitator CzcD-associated flavoprotein CzcO